MLLRAVVAATLYLAAAVNPVMACPMCQTALESDDPQPRAFMISILFMMGMIFTLFGLVSAFVWRMTRSERQALEDAGYGHLFENAVSASVTPEAAG